MYLAIAAGQTRSYQSRNDPSLQIVDMILEFDRTLNKLKVCRLSGPLPTLANGNCVFTIDMGYYDWQYNSNAYERSVIGISR